MIFLLSRIANPKNPKTLTMSHYIANKGEEEGEKLRRNRSKRYLEISPARTKLECHSSRFEHFPDERTGKLASIGTKFACARIVTS